MQYVYLNLESGIFITCCVERIGLDYLRLQKEMLLLVLSTSSVATEPFQQVSNTCIYWDLLDCHSGGDIEILHCILDENDQLGLVKVRWKWVGNGFCPYYDRSGKQIHVRPCDAALGSCPVVDIISYQAINYSACVSARWKGTSLNNNNYDKQGMTSSIRDMVQVVNRTSDTLTYKNCNYNEYRQTSLSNEIKLKNFPGIFESPSPNKYDKGYHNIGLNVESNCKFQTGWEQVSCISQHLLLIVDSILLNPISGVNNVHTIDIERIEKEAKRSQ